MKIEKLDYSIGPLPLTNKINQLIDAWNNQQEETKDLPFNDFLDNVYGSREEKEEECKHDWHYYDLHGIWKCDKCTNVLPNKPDQPSKEEKKECKWGIHSKDYEEEEYCVKCGIKIEGENSKWDFSEHKKKDQPSKPSIREELLELVWGNEKLNNNLFDAERVADQILDLVKKSILDTMYHDCWERHEINNMSDLLNNL